MADESPAHRVPATAFHGRCYLYQGYPIGVCQVLGANWAVCWISVTGARHRIKSKGLPVMTSPEKLQPLLDQWASLHKLEAVKI